MSKFSLDWTTSGLEFVWEIYCSLLRALPLSSVATQSSAMIYLWLFRNFGFAGLNIKDDKGEPIMRSPFALHLLCRRCILVGPECYLRITSRMNFVPMTSRIFDRSI